MMKCVLSLSISLGLIINGASAIPTCNSDRPGSESHRTLYIASSSLTNTEEDDKWTNALCCVYTHVEIRNDWDGWMQLYDGSWESMSGDTLPKMAEDAHDEICDMSMGSRDCSSQKVCVSQALSPSSPTFGPKPSPAFTPTPKPTIMVTNKPTVKSTSGDIKEKKRTLKGGKKKKKEKCQSRRGTKWLNVKYKVKIIIKTDSNPEDLSFKVQNPRKKGSVIYEKKENELTKPSHTYNFQFEVPNSACYRFIIEHKDGVGISGKESYKILYGRDKKEMKKVAKGVVSLKRKVVCFGRTCR